MRYSLFLILFLFPIALLLGQKVLQLEKLGKAKTTKYYIGQELSFQLNGDRSYWYEDVIRDILVEEGMVVFANRAVKLEEISALRHLSSRRWLRHFGNSLYVFGLGWGVFSLGELLVGGELTWAAAIVPASAFVLGWLCQKAGRPRKLKIGKKRRLRLLDISPPGMGS